MTILEHIDDAIDALLTRVNWYRSHGGRSLRHGKAYAANRARAEASLAFWREVRELHVREGTAP